MSLTRVSSTSLASPSLKTSSLLRCIGLPLTPRNFNLSTSTVGKAVLTWDSPIDIGVEITGYDVTIPGVGTINTGTSSTGYTWTGGTKGTSYSFTARAKSDVGNSPDTSSESGEIEGVTSTGGTQTTYTSGSTTYRVHSFTSNGTYTVYNGGTVQALVVGGGGGGAAVHHGHGWGGAGGAGYHSENTSLSVTDSTSHAVSVGGGGHGGHCCSSNGGGGGHSKLGSLITANGGSGGPRNTNGSGGGAKYSHITGSNVRYGSGGTRGHAGGGCTHCNAGGGGTGIVIVAYPDSVA
jgi:hypothetical protein